MVHTYNSESTNSILFCSVRTGLVSTNRWVDNVTIRDLQLQYILRALHLYIGFLKMEYFYILIALQSQCQCVATFVASKPAC